MKAQLLPHTLPACLALLCSLATAAPISPDQARQAAQTWLTRSPAFVSLTTRGTPAGAVLPNAAVPVADDGSTLAYGFPLATGGYIVLAADDRLTPVIAYSEENRLDLRETPRNSLLVLLRGDLGNRLRTIAAVEEQTAARTALSPAQQGIQACVQSAQQAWTDLLAATGAQRARNWDVDIGPLMQTFWGQDYDAFYGNDPIKNPTYNYYAPLLGANRTLTGCVATGLGQVAKYFAWPPSGVGQHSYTWNGQQLAVDFSQQTYQWNDMLNSYWKEFDEQPTHTEAQRQAVGRIIYDLGVSVDMEFSTTASLAAIADAPPALQNHFRYANATYVNQAGASALEQIRTNVTAGLPCVLGITSTTYGGHAAVCDGVRKPTGGGAYTYHLNFGWQGSNDGWYDISATFVTDDGQGEGPNYPGGGAAGGNTLTWASGFDEVLLDIIPGLILNDPGVSGAGDFDVTWQASTALQPQAYELQRAAVQSRHASRGQFLDDVEQDYGYWTVNGNWARIDAERNSAQTKVWWGRGAESLLDRTEYLTGARLLVINAGATVSYDYAVQMFAGQRATCQISTDFGATWTEIGTPHESTGQGTTLTWQQASIPLGAQYVDTVAMLRFVVTVTGGNFIELHIAGHAQVPFCGFYCDNITVTNTDVFAWQTVTDTTTNTTHQFTGTSPGRYFFRARPKKRDAWWGWSNIVDYTVETPATYTLTVASAHGTPDPAVGQHAINVGAEVQASCQEPAAVNGVRQRLTGWERVAGGQTTSGATASTTFNMDSNAALTWNWTTEHQLNVTVQGNGAVDAVDAQSNALALDQWLTPGTLVTLTATPTPGNVFAGWTGDLDAAANPGAKTLSALTVPRSLTAQFSPDDDTDTDNLPDAWELIYWTTINEADAAGSANPDYDDFTNEQEYQNNTHPLRPTIRLGPGWGLIAVSKTPGAGVKVSAQLAGSTAVGAWGWDGQQYVQLDDNGRNNDVMNPGQGYWVYATGECLFEPPGTDWGNATRNLAAGWNLVAPIQGGAIPQNAALQDVWTWNDNRYQALQPGTDTLDSTHGYWINCTEQTTLDLP